MECSWQTARLTHLQALLDTTELDTVGKCEQNEVLNCGR